VLRKLSQAILLDTNVFIAEVYPGSVLSSKSVEMTVPDTKPPVAAACVFTKNTKPSNETN
jgi:hypothetical protein